MDLHYKNLSLDDIVYIDYDGFKKTEEWRSVVGWEESNQVSDLGRIKSISRLRGSGKGFFVTKPAILTPKIYKNDYIKVSLNRNGLSKTISVHKLVAIAFLNHTPCGHKLVVDHIDNDKLNNKLSNLQLISSRENCSKDKKNNTSNYTGVLFRNGIYTSSINVGKKTINLGAFKSEMEASEYYQNAIKAIENGEEIKHKRKEKTSKFKGISYCKRDEKWVSEYYNSITRKSKRIGEFNTEKEAFEAREKYIYKNKINKL
jgi:hypothetical protein